MIRHLKISILKETLAAFLFLFILPACLQAATIGEISRTGSYLPDGSYRWNYTCRINADSKTPEQVTIGLTAPTDFPFQVTGLPKTQQVDALSGNI